MKTVFIQLTSFPGWLIFKRVAFILADHTYPAGYLLFVHNFINKTTLLPGQGGHLVKAHCRVAHRV
jgi:hypothetical protein